MITTEIIKRLEAAKTDPYLFQEEFVKILWDTCENSLTFLELDEVLELLYHGNLKTLHSLTDHWVSKSKQKVLESIEEGEIDPVYEDRYKKVKQVNDLITYYLEEKQN